MRSFLCADPDVIMIGKMKGMVAEYNHGIVLNRNMHQSKIFWKRVEYAALAAGFTGSAGACLANYNWHLFRESLFFMFLSIAPFCLLALTSHMARRLIKSNIIRPLSALFAVALTIFSLTAYLKAVLHPNHSSGMVFVIVPLMSMIAIVAVLIGVVLGSAAANLRGNKQA